MSYDLQIVGQVSLTRKELDDLVADGGIPGVTRAGVAGLVRRLAGEGRRPFPFGVDGPFRVEEGDLPPSWSQGQGAVVLYSISVGSPRREDISAAVAFADRLARRVRGVVVDPQVDPPVLSDDASTRVSPAEGRWLHLAWFRLRDDETELAANYLRVARSTLPMAVPLRFGSFEPMQGRFPRDPDEDFARVYREECDVSGLLFAHKGLSSGSISGWSRDVRMRYQSARVVLDLAAVEKAGAVDAVRALFVDLAQATGAFFAFAEVNRSERRTAEAPPYEGGWGGLPSEPQWMTWYGSAYAALVRPYLSAASTTPYGDGVLHAWTDAPAESTDIAASLTRTPWAGTELLSVIDPDDRQEILELARVIPADLRAPEPDSPEARRLEALFAGRRASERRA